MAGFGRSLTNETVNSVRTAVNETVQGTGIVASEATASVVNRATEAVDSVRTAVNETVQGAQILAGDAVARVAPNTARELADLSGAVASDLNVTPPAPTTTPPTATPVTPNTTDRLMRELKEAINGKGDLSQAYYAARAHVDRNRDGIIGAEESSEFVRAYESANGVGSANEARAAWRRISNDAAAAVANAINNPSGNLVEAVGGNRAVLDQNRDGRLDSVDQTRILELLREGGVDADRLPALLAQVQGAVGQHSQSFQVQDVSSHTQAMAPSSVPTTNTPGRGVT